MSWESALAVAVDGLRSRAGSLGALGSASATTEELYLLNRLTRGLGSPNIDHRLRARDFSDQAADALYPNLACASPRSITSNGLLVIGANLRREVPVLAHRVRKAALAGAAVAFVNPATFDYKFKVAAYLKSAPGGAGRAIWPRCWRRWPPRSAATVPAHLAAVAAGAERHRGPPGRGHGAAVGTEARGLARARWRCVIRSTPTCAPWPAPLRS